MKNSLLLSSKNYQFYRFWGTINTLLLLFGFRQDNQQSLSYVYMNRLEKYMLLVGKVHKLLSKQKGHVNPDQDLSLALSYLTFSLV